WRYLRALILGKLDELENPEILLQEAAREMRESLAANRQRAITAITQKNNLKALLDEQEKRIATLEAQAEMAVKKGDRDLARRILREKLTFQETVAATRASYEQAVQAAEAVKIAIRRQEEQVRQRTAEALAKKAQWKQAQIQIEIDKALHGLTFEEESSAWERASEKIRTAQSEAAARAELAQASIQAKIAELQDNTVDAEAEKALQELEQRMGLSDRAVEQQVQVGQTESDVESELAELESRLGTAAPEEGAPSGEGEAAAEPGDNASPGEPNQK
ncbi:MAG: PspA/IM30 family protein, partial [Armatimonadetes bacterium]|nr:PspA/IM30 family protein [Armatimonadota bacterium]